MTAIAFWFSWVGAFACLAGGQVDKALVWAVLAVASAVYRRRGGTP